MNDTTKAKSYLSFNLNMMLLMINCGRTEEAQRALAKLTHGIDELPDDIEIAPMEELHDA